MQEHPLAKSYRMKPLPSYKDLKTIFACTDEQGKDLKDDDGSAAQTSEFSFI